MPRIPALPRTLLAGLLIGSLAACSNLGPDLNQASGALQLHENLQIPPDSASVRLQYGRIVARNAVQEQDPFCVFEVEQVSTQPQTVTPGRFRIAHLIRSIESFAGMPVLPNAWPGAMNRRVSLGGDDSPTHIYYKTTFRLAPETPQDPAPQVRSLSCMSNQNAPGNAALMRHLTLAEIRAALGGWFSLIPPQ
jgi:hypothetical protein